MTDYAQDMEKLSVVAEVAWLVGVPTRRAVDTFGRPFLDIPVEGMQFMHSRALEMGQYEVAEDIRQMLARAERVTGTEWHGACTGCCAPGQTSCRICRRALCRTCLTDHHHEGYGTPSSEGDV